LQGDDAQTVLSLMPWDAPPESVRVAFAGWSRDERSPLAGIKCLSYAENLLALDLARATPDVDEFLFANSCGYWCEGTTSNGFAVIGGRLVTPSLQSGCLPGTMRVCVMEWAEALGIDCEERSIPVSEVAGATELFLTSAIRGVVPVVGCDGRQLPVGPITTRLRHEWGRRVRLGS
jgi:branched-subunit amino acid aminotransferase/4-amino-4-deoxychorismate lyase